MKIKKYDEVYLRVECEMSDAYELAEYFTFFVPGYKFMPAYKARVWDGKIRLFNPITKLVYAGCINHIERFCKERDYPFEIDDSFAAEDFSLHEAMEFVKTINLPMQARDYQIEAFVHAVRYNRGMLVSPTASGKSLIIYLLTKYYSRKTLIIVPTTTLVHQMATDFAQYGYGENIHKIFSGKEKQTDDMITITTWQSIYKLPQKWFDQYDVVIGDEAHQFKAKSLTSIMTKLVSCKYRFGFTGTLDGTETHKLVLEGLFGPVKNVITTSELMEKKHVSTLKIKAIILKYNDENRQLMKAKDYQQEMDFLVSNEARNIFIKNLALSLKGNTLLLFQYVDKHGKLLYNMLKDQGVNVHFIHGGVDGEDRDKIRSLVNDDTTSIIIASYGTFSTGINIPALHSVIFASPSKSRIRNLQSIGRGLRKTEKKMEATLFDIADDLSWKNKPNYTLNHFVDRIKIYAEEGFEYKTYKVKLNEKSSTH